MVLTYNDAIEMSSLVIEEELSALLSDIEVEVEEEISNFN